MDVEELIFAWKNQDAYIKIQMRDVTMQFLIKQKSNNVLKNIKRSLIRELLIIALSIVCFDALFFLAEIPFTALRWICFTIFNVTTFLHTGYYLITVRESNLNYGDDLQTNLKRIVHSFTQFRNHYKLVNVPIVFVCILMFAGSHDLFILIPWMILEFSFWRWILLPRFKSRFLDYKSDLEYTLKQLQESYD